eukprot:10262342-Prorocentrum_lima.AAC.1
MEVAALQRMNNLQSEELNARKGMVGGLMNHMEHHVGRVVMLRRCELESTEHLTKERRQRDI